MGRGVRPGAGWIGLDPTSGLFAGEGHIPLSATPHPESAAPITGRSTAVRDHARLLQRRHPCARGSAGHAAVHASGVGRDLRAGGPGRRTSGRRRCPPDRGGEPTFVSIDNQVDPKWTIDADGPHKRQRASALAARLKKVWAPQGLVQRSQGKWYPENRCRAGRSGWLAGRRGAAVARPTLLADPWSDGDHPILWPRGRGDHRFWERSPTALGSARRPRSGPPLRTALSRLAGEVRLPVGDPVAAATTSQTMGALPARHWWPGWTSRRRTAAYVLPVHRREDDTGWASAGLAVAPRPDRPARGDSPAGLRLPLNAISWRPPATDLPGRPAAPAAAPGRWAPPEAEATRRGG